ncbi:MAG: HAMP domain-containing sensor histidine kinase [Elusimicrobiota bacterium]
MAENLEQKTAAYLTHELRAPLTSIRCALETIKDCEERLPADERQMLDIALRNTERLKNLIDDILDLSKLQAGRMRVFPVPCDPRALAAEAVESLSPLARKKGIDLALEVSPPCAAVDADPRRTVQVLINLLSNALKFTPAGGRVRVRVEAGKGDRAGYALFSVSDTGCGIAAGDLPRVFRFFSQAAAGERRMEGTGLGLAISRSMVELQGGEIGVESEPGKGSTFSFTLPTHIALEEKDPQPRPAAERA